MGNVKSIEKAIESLPASDLAEFRRWFDAEKRQKAVGELTGHECRRIELEKLRQREWSANH